MNIFEFLGLGKLHRKLSNKVTQLVKHYDEVPQSRKTGKRLAMQVKRDGVCAITVVSKEGVKIFSRTGNLFTNTGYITEELRGMNLPFGIYMGEMLVQKDIASLEEFSGVVNPNRVNSLSHEMSTVPLFIEMHFFDILPTTAFVKGASGTPYHKRHEILKGILSKRDSEKVVALEYTNMIDEDHLDEFLQELIKDGEEGAVIRDLDAGWEAGHKGWRVMKRVRGVDYDLACIGIEEGTGKYKGKAANLIFKWKGDETITCMLGKGWGHKDAEEFFINPPIGEIFQVYALEESSKGKLRLPKVGEKRHDKTYSDINV